MTALSTKKLTSEQIRRFEKTLKFHTEITHEDGFGDKERSEAEKKLNSQRLIYLSKTYIEYASEANGASFMHRVIEMKKFLIANDAFDEEGFYKFVNADKSKIKQAILELSQSRSNQDNYDLFEFVMSLDAFEEYFLDTPKKVQDEFLRLVKTHNLDLITRTLQMREISTEDYTDEQINYHCPVVQGLIAILRYGFTYDESLLGHRKRKEESLKPNLVAYLTTWSIPPNKSIEVEVFIELSDSDKYKISKLNYASAGDLVHEAFIQLNGR